MLRALGFGCCASAPFDFFFVFFGRGAAYSILALRASLVSLRRRDVRLCVQDRFDLSSRGVNPALVAGVQRGVFMAYNGSGVGQ